MTRHRNYLWAVICAALIGCAEESPTAHYPAKPIKVIVPFGAGGGSDTFSRIIQKAIEDNQLLPEPIVIINVPGAGGTIGSRRAKSARPDGYTMMMMHEGIITTKYAGKVNYGPEAFEPIAGTGEAPMCLCVAADSPYKTLQDLVDDAVTRPDEVIFSANIGAPSQYIGLMLERLIDGARFRYSQSGDGAKRFAGLQGGHADASSFNLAEYMQFKDAGMRALAVARPTRHPQAPEVPTAEEQGYDLVSMNMHFWWAPKGTPEAKRKVIAEALERAMQTEFVQDRLNKLRMDPRFITGEELSENLADRTERIANVTPQPIHSLPNFPMWTLAIAGGLGIAIAFQTARQPKMPLPEEVEEQVQLKRFTAVAVLILTAIYVAILQLLPGSFRVATIAFVIITGLLLTKPTIKSVAFLGVLAVGLGIGLHALFTQVFVVDLP